MVVPALAATFLVLLLQVMVKNPASPGSEQVG